MKSVDRLILSGLTKDIQFVEKVMPFLQTEYFLNREEAIVFEYIAAYYDGYKDLPNKSTLNIAVDEDTSLTEAQVQTILTDVLPDVFDDEVYNVEWLTDEAEKFCQDRALYNAINHALKIADGEDKNLTKDSIPHVIQQALSVSFDAKVGHDFVQDAATRYDQYQTKEQKISFRLSSLDGITKGGYEKSTLNIVMAATGVGKSIFLCNVAANAAMQGLHVLYITLEMAENKILQRIEQNLFDMDVDDIMLLSKDEYLRRVESFASKQFGKIKVKQYPTASAHVGHFRALLNDLKTKEGFAPDVIVVDYVNICASSRYKPSSNNNSYTIVKAIAEEVRGMAVEYQASVWTATQPTREGMGSSDIELKDTSESIGLPQTADFMMALITNDQLERMDQVVVKQLKNRYDGINSKNRRFILGLNKDRMRFFDVDTSEQTLMADYDEEPDKPFTPTNKPRRKFGR